MGVASSAHGFFMPVLFIMDTAHGDDLDRIKNIPRDPSMGLAYASAGVSYSSSKTTWIRR
jgi:hypothetical protein